MRFIRTPLTTSRRSRLRERGQSLAEMALVLPMLLILIFGVVEFSMALRSYQQLTNATIDLLGASGVVWDAELHEMQHAFIFSRAHTIYAGSSQVQRNIIGERVLGLPKEPG